MTGRQPLSDPTNHPSTERQTRIAGKAGRLRAEMALHELRRAREPSQDDLARALHVGQPAVAKMERRADMCVSNFRRYIEAPGGSLKITARFPDAYISISNFAQIETAETEK